MAAPEKTSLPPVYAELANSRNLAADAALAVGLSDMEAEYQGLALGVLLRRDHDASLAQVVATYAHADVFLKTLILQHADDLAGGVRVCMSHALFESRRSAILLVHDSLHAKGAYLLSEAIIKPCRHTANLAAEVLLSLAERIPATSTRWASAKRHQPQGQVEYVSAAVTRALGSWPLHFRNEVALAAVLLAEPLEDTIVRMAEDSRSHLGRALNNAVAGSRDPRLVGYCLRVLRCAPLRSAAVKCLASMSNSDADIALADHGWLLLDPEVRRSCAWIKEAPLLNREDIETLVENPRRANSVVRFLKACGCKPNLRVSLMGRLAMEADPVTRRAAFWSLMESEHEDSGGMLQTLASRGCGRDSYLAALELRRRASRSLAHKLRSPTESARGQVDSGDAFEPFWIEYDSLDAKVRRVVANNLLEGIPQFDDHLRGKWASGETEEQIRVLKMVEDTGRFEVFISQIQDASSSSDAVLRSLAVRLLGVFDDAKSRRLVRGALQDGDLRVQANAVESFGQSQSSDCESLLRQKLSSENNRVRGNAVKALLQMRVRDGAEELLRMLSSPHSQHRLSALWVVERLNLKQLMARLTVLADQDADPKIQRRAQRITATFQSGSGGNAEADATEHRNEVTA
ncbi:MAG: HEAT repeat domain-containing protein [Planctomycetes bacterium]|nr:HEAT repeat domain-containing protein [Planctomycetota bacterium]